MVTYFIPIFLNLVYFIIDLVQLASKLLWFVQRTLLSLTAFFLSVNVGSFFIYFILKFFIFFTRFLHKLFKAWLQVNKELLLRSNNTTRTTKSDPCDGFFGFKVMLVHQVASDQSSSAPKTCSAMYSNRGSS